METFGEGIVFDYRLGYVRAGRPLSGFDAIGEDGAPRVLALGGYTTPEQAERGLSWPNLLHGLFLRGGKPVQILSGDTDGYSSAQEMLMLIRDGILLKPEIAVCLSGFYDFAYGLGFLKKEDRKYAEILRKHPFTNLGQLKYYGWMTARFPLGRDKMHYGEENSAPAWENWIRHMDIVHCLCEEFGIRHTAFLQPCVFSGQNVPEKPDFDAFDEEYGFNPEEMAGYWEAFRQMYGRASEAAKSREYIVDLSGLFGGGDFLDPCHLSETSLEILTGEIYKNAGGCGL
jgi:hypothetical protein